MSGAIRRYSTAAAAAVSSEGYLDGRRLADLGVTEHDLSNWVRMGALLRIRRGLYRFPGHQHSWVSRVYQAAVAYAPAGSIGFRTAAAWWGLANARELVIEVVGARSAVRSSRLARAHGVTDLLPSDVVEHRNTRVTSPLRTVIDCARFADEIRLRHLVDDGVEQGHFSYDEIGRRFLEVGRRGKPGTVRLREVLETRTSMVGPSSSFFERAFADLIVDAGLPQPVREYRVDVGGRTFYIDFFWPSWNLGVECDSVLAHSGATALAADLERQNALLSTGLQLLRFTYDHVVRRPEYVYRQLHRALMPRAA